MPPSPISIPASPAADSHVYGRFERGRYFRHVGRKNIGNSLD
jgi:hypothetical protein